MNSGGAEEDGTSGEDHEPESNVIPRGRQVALGRQEEIKVGGDDYDTPDGSCVRDYVHVEDLGEIHRTAIENQPSGQFRFYNVGTGVGVSVKELIAAARDFPAGDILARLEELEAAVSHEEILDLS